MLANPWEVVTNLDTPSIHDYGQARDLGLLPAWQCDIQEAARLLEVRIIKKIVRFGDRRKRQTNAVAFRHQLILRHGTKEAFQNRHNPCPGLGTQRIRLQAGVIV